MRRATDVEMKGEKKVTIMNSIIKTGVIIFVSFIVCSCITGYHNDNTIESRKRILDFIHDNKITESICSIKDTDKRLQLICTYNELISSLCTYYSKEEESYYIEKFSSLSAQINAELICEINYGNN